MDRISDQPFRAKGCLVLLGLLVLAYFFLQVAIVLGMEMAQEMRWLPPDALSNEVVHRVTVSLTTPLLLMFITLSVLKNYFPTETYKSLFKSFGFAKAISPVQLILSLVVGISIILFLKKFLMVAFPPGPAVTASPSAVIEHAALWAKLVVTINMVTLVPIAEEFVFRGVLYKGFTLSWGKIVSAIIVCIVFSMAHLDGLNTGYWVNQFALTFIPVVFVVAREITGALYSPIPIHAGLNFGSVFIM